mgnify:CR=1 FL=1
MPLFGGLSHPVRVVPSGSHAYDPTPGQVGVGIFSIAPVSRDNRCTPPLPRRFVLPRKRVTDFPSGDQTGVLWGIIDAGGATRSLSFVASVTIHASRRSSRTMAGSWSWLNVPTASDRSTW